LVTSCVGSLPKQVIEETLEGRIDMTVGRGRRRKQLLDELTERRGHRNLEEEALDHTVWITGFRRRIGPVVRQMKE